MIAFRDHPLRHCLGVVLLACLGLLGACASLPDVRQLFDSRALYRITPRLSSARGLLSPERSAAVLAKLKRQAGDTDILQRHLALEEAIAGTPLVIGNNATLLEDGPATYEAIFSAIRNAKHNINLETFIIEDDELGNQLASLLIEKRAQGVEVNLIYDSVGSITTPSSFFDRLKASGIRVVEFNPIDPSKVKKVWSLNHRDHRKLLVVDGAVAFTGGVNVSAVYSVGSFGRSGARPATDKDHIPWRDTDVRIEGPVVADFQRIFLATWKSQKGDPLAERDYFPPLEPRGHEVVRAIASTPDSPASLIYITLLSAITYAEGSVHLTNAYFVPDPQLLDALKGAARRGVDVTLILPSHSDFWPALAAGRSHYEDLLEAGVKIYERRDALLHAKTAVIDGVWSTVGSTNLDWRSFLDNNEINAVVLGQEFARDMEAMFAKDLRDSNRITAEQWQRRPVAEHVKEWAARVWERWW